MTHPHILEKNLPQNVDSEARRNFTPIKSPHHKALIDIKDIKDIEIRFGYVVKQNDSLYVDVGLEKVIRYNGIQLGKKVLVKISNKGKLLAEDISKEEIDGYWGYDVQFADSLSALLENTKGEILMTSVEGSPFTKHVADLMSSLKKSKNLLVVFGGPKFGLRKILESENVRINQKPLF